MSGIGKQRYYMGKGRRAVYSILPNGSAFLSLYDGENHFLIDYNPKRKSDKLKVSEEISEKNKKGLEILVDKAILSIPPNSFKEERYHGDIMFRNKINPGKKNSIRSLF